MWINVDLRGNAGICEIKKNPYLCLYIIMYKGEENGKSEEQQPIADRVEG